MLRKELLESFHKLEEKVHVLGGCLASTFVLTWAIQHELNEQHAKQVAEFLEVLHKILLGLDVAISILLVLGLTFRAVGIRKPNITLARIAKDKELNERIQLWFTENGVDPKEPNVRFCREDCIDELTRLNYTAFENTQPRSLRAESRMVPSQWKSLHADRRPASKGRKRGWLLRYVAPYR